MTNQATQQLERARQEKKRKHLTVLAGESYDQLLSEAGWEDNQISETFDIILANSMKIAKVLLEEETWEKLYGPEGKRDDSTNEGVIAGAATSVIKMVQDRLEGKATHSLAEAAERLEAFKDGVRRAIHKSMI